MPGRSFNSSEYRYGWNKGSEKDDEITGVTGSHYTTYFREFDTRLNRTWSVDPSVAEWESPYAVNRNNPIVFVDPMGDWPKWLGGKGGSKYNLKTVGKRDVNNNVKTWRGLANIFKSPGTGRTAPAGRARNNGWSEYSDEQEISASGNPIDRTDSENLFKQIGSRGTLTAIEVRGNASNPLTRFAITGGTSQANQRSLFASNGLQNIDPRGSLRAITDDGGVSPYGIGDFEARSGFLPFLNSLPTVVQLMRGPFSTIFGDNATNWLMGSVAANSLWMANAFNQKPLLSGKVWSLNFSAYSPHGGTVNYQYRYKSKSWQSYEETGKSGFTKMWHNLLYGYD